MITTSITRPITSKIASAIAGARQGGVSYHYYISASTGNDSNDGLSLDAAWKSLNKIESITGTGGTAAVLVASGTYDTANDHFEVIGFSGVLDITFEPGCIMDGTVHGSTAQNPIYAGNVATVMTIRGNGLIVRNYSGNTGGSPNGLGYGGEGTILTVYDVTIDTCQDGISGHTTGHAEIHRCVFKNNIKYQCANIDSSTMNAYSCTWYTDEVGDFVFGAEGLQRFERCAFIDDGAGAFVALKGNNMQFFACQIGDLTHGISIGANGTNSATQLLVNSCFINVTCEAWDNYTFDKCYGYLSARARNGSGTFTVTNSVIVGGYEGSSNITYTNSDFGGSTKQVVNNNIFVGTVSIGNFGTLGRAQYVVDAGSEYFNNITYGGASYHANFLAADSGSAVIVGTIASDPLIGDADTLEMADYAFGDGSPAIDAATDGGDIGFGSSDVVSVGVP